MVRGGGAGLPPNNPCSGTVWRAACPWAIPRMIWFRYAIRCPTRSFGATTGIAPEVMLAEPSCALSRCIRSRRKSSYAMSVLRADLPFVVRQEFLPAHVHEVEGEADLHPRLLDHRLQRPMHRMDAQVLPREIRDRIVAEDAPVVFAVGLHIIIHRDKK